MLTWLALRTKKPDIHHLHTYFWIPHTNYLHYHLFVDSMLQSSKRKLFLFSTFIYPLSYRRMVRYDIRWTDTPRILKYSNMLLLKFSRWKHILYLLKVQSFACDFMQRNYLPCCHKHCLCKSTTMDSSKEIPNSKELVPLSFGIQTHACKWMYYYSGPLI